MLLNEAVCKGKSRLMNRDARHYSCRRCRAAIGGCAGELSQGVISNWFLPGGSSGNKETMTNVPVLCVTCKECVPCVNGFIC